MRLAAEELQGYDGIDGIALRQGTMGRHRERISSRDIENVLAAVTNIWQRSQSVSVAVTVQ